jgi:pilT protein domain protein
MVLADTNIFIDFWNSPTDELIKCFEREDIVICGVVRAELLHGAISDTDFNNIVNLLNAFDEKLFDNDDWQLLGSNLYKLRRKGLTVPFSDAIIATLAIKYDIPVWTGDKHFLLIQNVLTNLKLFNINSGL